MVGGVRVAFVKVGRIWIGVGVLLGFIERGFFYR